MGSKTIPIFMLVNTAIAHNESRTCFTCLYGLIFNEMKCTAILTCLLHIIVLTVLVVQEVTTTLVGYERKNVPHNHPPGSTVTYGKLIEYCYVWHES